MSELMSELRSLWSSSKLPDVPWEPFFERLRDIANDYPVPIITLGNVEELIRLREPELLPVEFEEVFGGTTIRCAGTPSPWLRDRVEAWRPAGWLITWEIWP